MSSPITLIVESVVLPGKLEQLRDTVKRVAEHCAASESGLLRYDWYVDESGETLRVVETYADSDAIRFHMQNYSMFLPALDELRQMKNLTLLGEPDAELAQALAARGAAVFAPFGSLPG